MTHLTVVSSNVVPLKKPASYTLWLSFEISSWGIFRTQEIPIYLRTFETKKSAKRWYRQFKSRLKNGIPRKNMNKIKFVSHRIARWPRPDLMLPQYHIIMEEISPSLFIKDLEINAFLALRRRLNRELEGTNAILIEEGED